LRYATENKPSSRVVTENSYIKIENTIKKKPGKSQRLKPLKTAMNPDCSDDRKNQTEHTHLKLFASLTPCVEKIYTVKPVLAIFCS
jgi:hypothetical protein